MILFQSFRFSAGDDAGHCECGYSDAFLEMSSGKDPRSRRCVTTAISEGYGAIQAVCGTIFLAAVVDLLYFLARHMESRLLSVGDGLGLVSVVSVFASLCFAAYHASHLFYINGTFTAMVWYDIHARDILLVIGILLMLLQWASFSKLVFRMIVATMEVQGGMSKAAARRLRRRCLFREVVFCLIIFGFALLRFFYGGGGVEIILYACLASALWCHVADFLAFNDCSFRSTL